MPESTEPEAHLISRRRALGLAGVVSVGAAATIAATNRTGAAPEPVAPIAPTAAGSPAVKRPPSDVELLKRAGTCTLVRESIEGPYYLDGDLLRRDIREGRPGTSLRLALRVLDVSRCARGGRAVAVPDALVELWQCDSGGIYSSFEAASLAAGGRPPQPGTGGGDEDRNSLRGAQISNGNGIVRFTTIYPGWYPGRSVHMHLKVRLDARTLLTTQLYFDDAISDAVLRAAPYGGRSGRRTSNEDDAFFDRTGLLDLHRRGQGYLGVLNLGVDL
ncbi:MAG: dioxygenase family protein [Sporichthyaceae bacterium]